MLKNDRRLKLILIFETTVFFLIVSGYIPRDFVPYFVAILSAYLIWAPLEEGTLFFISSIPMFLAIPIVAGFDNFNSWRIFSSILFLKWFLSNKKNWLRRPISSYKGALCTKVPFVQRAPLQSLLGWSLTILAILAVISVGIAGDKILAVKRIIYFANLILIGFVLFDLLPDQEFKKKVIRFITFPVILVTLVGFIQLVSTYFLDIFQFVGIWGERIQCNQFGQEWCSIATRLGNTWFAYYGDQLSLRMFSLFPDSHSFPIFLILGLPAILAVAMTKMNWQENFKKLISTRTKLFILWVPLIFLAVILTGTRGFWAASIGVILLTIGIMIFMSKKKEPKTKYFSFITSYIILFFMMFVIAYPIFISPQFLLLKGDWGMLGNRIKSAIDFGETSNAQRIEIWTKTLVSIKKHPLLGVGIGNYPTVLSQDLELSRAGSSAHNLYLHVAAEMGLLALIALAIFLIELFRRIYKNFATEENTFLLTYYGSALIFVPWVFGYLMTDVAIFDERAFLMLVVSVALLIKNPD